MVPAQDRLVTLPHDRYGEYLVTVYRRMAEYVPPDAVVLEIGARHDRGVLSRPIIPHAEFYAIDRDPERGDVTLDVLEAPVEADVILSTCVLHHTPEEDVPRLLANLRAPLLMFSGPNIEVMPDLFGDHAWHIEVAKLTGWLADLGYTVRSSRIGLSEPLAEVLVVAER